MLKKILNMSMQLKKLWLYVISFNTLVTLIYKMFLSNFNIREEREGGTDLFSSAIILFVKTLNLEHRQH